MKLPDHDDARLQRQGLILLPQEVAPAGCRILEVVGVDDTSHALPGGHQRPANVQIPAKGIIVLGYRGPHHSLTAKIPGSVVDNVSGTEIIINGSLSLIIPELMCHSLSHSPPIDIVQFRGPHIVPGPGWPGLPHKHPRAKQGEILSL